MSDVRYHLAAILEALGDPDAKPEVIEHAKAASMVASTYISIVKTEIDAMRLADDTGKLSAAVDPVTPVDTRVVGFERRAGW